MADEFNLDEITTMDEILAQKPKSCPEIPALGEEDEEEDMDEYGQRLFDASRQRILWTFATARSKSDLAMEIQMSGNVSARDPLEEYQLELEANASKELFIQIFGHAVDESR